MKRIILIFSIIFISRSFSIACSCSGPNDFCTTINNQGSDLIIKGVKVSRIFHGMKVKVLEMLSGSESNDTIMVWGDDGALCRVYTDNFSVSDTFILALYHTDFAHNLMSGDSIEQPGDYHLSVCGMYFLNVVNDSVVGYISDTINRQITYMDFKTNMCTITSTLNTIHQQPEDIEIYPNPFIFKTTLKIKNKKNDHIKLTLFTITGKVIRQIETDKDEITIEKGELSHGIYFYQVYGNGLLRGEGKLIVE